MRAKLCGSLVITGLVSTFVGCGGGGSGSGGQGQTIAPQTSKNVPQPSPSPVPVTSPSPAPVVSPTPSPSPATGNTTAVGASLILDQISKTDIAGITSPITISVGKQPTGVAIHGTYAYVASEGNQAVQIVDLLANQVTATMDTTAPGVTNLPLIGSTIDPVLKNLVRPTSVCVMPNGTKAFSANLINVVSYDLGNNKPLNSIMCLNINIASLITAITSGQGIQSFLAQPLLGLGQARVACTNQSLFVTNMITGNVTLIDATDDKVITNTNVGTIPLGVACAAGKAYVACLGSGDIWVLDELTGVVKKSFAAPGQVPVDVTASPTGDKVYVANLLSGDITVIDTATDLPVNTLPAGLSISQIFTQLGLPIPATSSGGIGGAISSFLSGFLGSSGAGPNPGLGGLLGGSGGPISPGSLISGLMSAFLSFAGISQQSLAGLNFPGIGVIAMSVSADGTKLVGANVIMGMTVTDIATSIVTGPQFLNGSGLGEDAVACGR